MHQDCEKILFSHEEIEKRCIELGEEMTTFYQDKKVPIVVGLLKGSVPFMSELIKHIDLDIEIDFMDVSSYEGTESVGDVRIVKDLDRSIRDQNILLVEDIVDTGKTLAKVKELLYQKGASDVKIITLLDKPSRRVQHVEADFVGFKVPDCFIIGFGLDYNQKYRNLPYVGILKKEIYIK